MEKKKSKFKKFIILILLLLFSFIVGGVFTFGMLFVVSDITGIDIQDSLKGETFKISDVVILNESSNYTIENINTSISEVVVRGNKKELGSIYVIKPELTINENEINESGIYKVNAILKAYDSSNNLIEDVEIVPSNIKVELDIVSLARRLPVDVRINGVPAAGRSVANIRINGQNIDDYKITVFGDPEALDKLKYVPVSINLNGTGQSDTATFNVELSLPEGITNVSERNLEIVVEFGDSVTKTVVINDIAIRNLNDGLMASRRDSSLTVEIEGMPEVLSKISANDIEAYVDLNGYGVGEYNVKVSLFSDYYFVYTIGNITVNIYEKEKTEI